MYVFLVFSILFSVAFAGEDFKTPEQKTYAIILAGGNGTRLWPKSRQRFPKQLSSFTEKEGSLLLQTLERLDGMVPPANRIVITNKKLISKVRETAGHALGRILVEPEGKSTAAALIWGAMIVEKEEGGSATLLCFSSDHYIKTGTAWTNSLKQAIHLAKQSHLVLFGVSPSRPETAYGYIKRGKPLGFNPYPSYEVKKFEEKPNLATAQKYLDDGNFYWNAGIFAWDSSVFLKAAEKFAGTTYQLILSGVKNPKKFLENFHKIKPESVDRTIIEQSDSVAMIEAPFHWDDLGTWTALERCQEPDIDGNIKHGLVVDQGSTNSILYSQGPLLATIGLDGYVVVAVDDAVLVCPKSESQNVRKIVSELKRLKLRNYL